MPGTPTLAAVEPMLMIRAFLVARCGKTAWVMKTAARTLVSNMSEKSCSVSESIGVGLLTPALLTRMSMQGPNAPLVASTILRDEVVSRRSARTLMAVRASPVVALPKLSISSSMPVSEDAVV